MHPQLTDVLTEFESASARLAKLVADVPETLWHRRPHPDSWSVAECVEHLNITGRKYLPILDRALDDAKKSNSRAPSRYRRDFVGWLLWKTMPPPVRQRTKTTAEFLPVGDKKPAELVAEFNRLQQEQMARTRAFEGLPLQKVKVKSPFNEKVSYNAYSCLTILPRHQHRHLWQAEQGASVIRESGS